MIMSERCKVKCRAFEGIFGGEWIVRIQTSSGQVQSIVDESCLDFLEEKDARDQEGILAALEAYCLDKADDLASIILPQPTISNGPAITVPENQLIPG